MEQEHERAAGAWQSEWGTLSELITLTSSAASWARELVEHLEVDELRMRENLTRLVDGEEPDLGGASELVDRALRTKGST